MIRNARPDDAERLARIFAYYVKNTAVTFEYEAPSADEFRNRIRETQENYPFLVFEEDGTVQGYAYAGLFRRQAAYARACELTIYLDPGARGRGCGRALYEALEAELKKRGILNLYACIADPPAEDEYLTKDSERFHQRLGFVKVGEFHKCGFKFGRWYDMIWMEKLIGEHT